MNKKNMVLVGTLVAGISLFTITALATTGNNSGYEVFKEAMKQSSETKMGQSKGSMEGKFEIVDNGESLISVSGSVNVQEDQQALSGDLILSQGTVQTELEFYEKDKLMIVKDVENDLYYSFDHEDLDQSEYNNEAGTRRFKCGDMNRNHDFGSEMHEWSESGENIMDALVGKYKDQFELSVADDGAQVVSFDLTKEEVPAVLNVLVAEAVKSDNYHRMGNQEWGTDCEDFAQFMPFLEGFNFDKEQLPKLTDDVAIERITMAATLDENNVMTGHSMLFVISGKDADGLVHEFEFKGTMTVVEESEVEVIDTTGKVVQSIDLPENQE